MNQLIKLKLKKWCKWVWIKAKNNPMYSIPVSCFNNLSNLVK
jgi:hypothetical protein